MNQLTLRPICFFMGDTHVESGSVAQTYPADLPGRCNFGLLHASRYKFTFTRILVSLELFLAAAAVKTWDATHSFISVACDELAPYATESYFFFFFTGFFAQNVFFSTSMSPFKICIKKLQGCER